MTDNGITISKGMQQSTTQSCNSELKSLREKTAQIGIAFGCSQRVGSCYLEVSFGTTGVGTWCYLECYLVLSGVLPGVTWALPGRYLALPGVLFWSRFFYGPKISAFLKLKLLEKNQFPLRDVTWAHACSRYLFTWPTL